jgi:prolipoprotein diacylglyceryltransferase
VAPKMRPEETSGILLRQELEAKIEKKLSKDFFFWAVPLILAVIGSILWYIVAQLDKNADKYNDLNRRLIVIETRIEERKK